MSMPHTTHQDISRKFQRNQCSSDGQPSNMYKLNTFLLSALCAMISRGGSMQLFFCQIAGCAANVTTVFCNDQFVWNNTTPAAYCSGPPPPGTVCQHEGRAFVSTSTNGSCEFENTEGYIETTSCSGSNISICSFTVATIHSTRGWNSSSMLATPGREHPGCIIGVCLLLLVVVGGGLVIICKKRQAEQAEQQNTSDSRKEVLLTEVQISGGTSERPGLENGSRSDDGA
ncbi:uncharacterized protein LOC114440719 isoform X2 [Parambassis ranga]|uniref:Uncharacterized protein LOC114440719 isoform X2 n=1 Tax=Parambassis ranga TaxID=210632 RepID=A0A6P7IT67_9TELE|nr:uncharacterized protein LOC114440719 isoform X2 [Parambassis ranga]